MSNLAQEIPPIFGELERCKKWIEDALEYSGGTHDYKDVSDSVLKGEMHLWSGEKCCTVTLFTVYPKKRFLHVFLAGGDLDEILEIEKSMVEFAKQTGCDGLTLSGRVGWKKVLRDIGWSESFLTLIKEI
jgi:hypothetical protein